MKVLAPVRSADEVAPLLDAGAQEFYCGLTPPDWERDFGSAWSNRRSARSAGVADLDELRRIVALAGARPVFATLNSPSYPAGAVPRLVEFGRQLLADAGVSALIVAEWELMLALVDAGLAPRLHVSSLASCRNPGAAAFYRDLGVARVILPRHVTLTEIEAIAIPGLEFEVFVLNDGCVFEEGLCATTHALGTFCMSDQVGSRYVKLDERYEFWKWLQNNSGCQTSRGITLGPCGLCALPRLARAGVASLKVVGREASLARKAASVRLAAAALAQAQAGAAPEGIRAQVIALRGAPELCENARLCYYPDVWKQPAAAPAAPADPAAPAAAARPAGSAEDAPPAAAVPRGVGAC